jgi:hypothetical protein
LIDAANTATAGLQGTVSDDVIDAKNAGIAMLDPRLMPKKFCGFLRSVVRTSR